MSAKKFSIVPIFLVVLVDLLAMMMMVPLLPFYAQRFGASPVEIGFLAASFSLCQLIASPILGQISDRVGRKPVLIVSQLGTLLGFVLMVVANQLWVLFLARILDGITAGNISLAQAYVADGTDQKDRTRAFGILGIALGMGLLLGPAVSGWLAGYNLAYPLYLAIGLSSLSILASALLLKGGGETENSRNSHSKMRLLDWDVFSSFVRHPDLQVVLGQFVFYVIAFGVFSQGIGLFAERKFLRADGTPFGPAEVGYLFAYCGLLGILIQGVLLGKLVKYFGEIKLVQIGFLSDVLGYALLGYATNPIHLILSSTCFSFGNSVLRPALTSLITQQVRKEEQGRALGLASSFQSFGQMVGPPLGGLLIQSQMLFGWAFLLVGLCIIPICIRLWHDLDFNRRHSCKGERFIMPLGRRETGSLRRPKGMMNRCQIP